MPIALSLSIDLPSSNLLLVRYQEKYQIDHSYLQSFANQDNFFPFSKFETVCRVR